MEFKLCYKPYDCKMSLGAMKAFKEATGRDLWGTLIEFILVYHDGKGLSVFDLCRRLYQTVDFETGSQAFYCMAKECNKNLSLDEIQDGMFHVGWRPSERPDDMSEPWPIILVQLAMDVDQYFTELASEKKPLADSSVSEGESATH